MIYLPSFDTIDKCAGRTRGIGGRNRGGAGTGGTTGHLIQFCVIFKECSGNNKFLRHCWALSAKNGQMAKQFANFQKKIFKHFVHYSILCVLNNYLPASESHRRMFNTLFTHFNTQRIFEKKFNKKMHKVFENLSSFLIYCFLGEHSSEQINNLNSFCTF